MSKSITGSGSLNLTLNELRLLEIKATSIESTNATITNQLNGNNATFTGTVSLGNLTITGTFQVVNLTSTGTITANDIVCSGEITYKSQTLDNRFVTNANLTTILNDYVLTTTLNSTLNNYVLTTTLNSTLNNYVLTTTLNSTLNNYVLTTDLNNTLNNYVLTTTLNSTLNNYVLTTTLNSTLNNYVLTTTLNSTLNNYVDLSSAQTITGQKTFDSIIISNSISQPIQSIQTSNNYNVLFYDSTSSQITEDAGNNLQYNPNSNTLTVGNVTINTEAVLSNTSEATSSSFLNILFKNSGNQIRIGQTASHPFQFRPSNGTLLTTTVDATTLQATTLQLDSQANIGTLTTDTNGMNYNHALLHKFLINNNQVLTMSNSVIGFNRPMDFLQDGNITMYETSASFSGVKNEIDFNNIAKITSRRENTTLNPQLDLVNNTASSSIDYQIRLDTDETLYNTPTGGSHKFQVNSVDKVSIDSNFQVDLDMNVTGTATFSNSIVQPVDTDGTNNDFTLVFYDTTTSSLKRDTNPAQLVYNPSNNTISCRNIEVAVDTTTQNLTVSGTLDATLNPSDASTTATMRFLGYDTITGTNKKSNSTTTFGRGLFTGQEFIRTEQFYADQFMVDGALPLNYVSAYSCDEWDTNGGVFGNDDYVKLNKQASEGGSPTVYQYGANISSGTSPVIRSAINYAQTASPTYWRLSNNAYAGMWYVDVTCVFQNLKTGSGDRMIPYIRIQKNDGVSWNEQRQLSVGMQYVRYTAGEASSLRIQGAVYLEDTSDLLRIYTKLDIGNNVSPPAFTDSATSGQWAGLQINISMRYLGKADSVANSEVINAL